MKTIYDLNKILFEAMERVNNPELKGQDLEAEKIRAKAIQGQGGVMVKNFSLELDATIRVNSKDLPPNRGLIDEALPLSFRKTPIKKLEN